ncbi:MAG TPA: hypothetical protein VJI98_05575 [Candidatus Nanoarchaeia archaeon]|nr:hypothetical protein [Candidatus Nanoarchaeia archaeon]
MPRPLFKKKCGICTKEWVVINSREYPVCVSCHMKQILSEEITDKKFNFLNIDLELYKKSKFLRSIRQSYLMYKSLTEKQIEAFKKAVKELAGPKQQSEP